VAEALGMRAHASQTVFTVVLTPRWGSTLGGSTRGGPVGLEGVVIYRYVLKTYDESHIVEEFGREPGKKTIHA
jgi:hypothetical protein